MFLIRDMVSYSLREDGNLTGDIGGSRVEIKSRNFYKEYIRNANGNVPTRDLKYGRFGGKKGVKLDKPLDVLITGLFRTNMWCDNPSDVSGSDYLGWFKEYDGLWQEQYMEVLANLSGDFTDSDSDKKKFIREKGPYQRYVYNIGTYQQERPPELLRDMNGNKYILTEDDSFASHGMTLKGTSWDKSDRDVEIKNLGEISQPHATYMEYDEIELVESPGRANYAIPDGSALVDVSESWEGNARYYEIT